jgi:hypothetical protein
VPLDGNGGQVLVGGDLLDAGYATVPYAASVENFIAARRWDHTCLNSTPVLQAQAAELDQPSLGYLRARLARQSRRQAGPGRSSTDLKIKMRESCPGRNTGQCDWWISASSEPSLKTFAAGLLDLSNLRSALWSNDDSGARLLEELRTAPH